MPNIFILGLWMIYIVFGILQNIAFTLYHKKGALATIFAEKNRVQRAKAGTFVNFYSFVKNG